MININNRENSIWNFCIKWYNKGKEESDDRTFWIDILQQVLGADNATERIEFQKKVIVNNKTKKIDAYIPETKVLIEQKSSGVPLDKKILQSDGIYLTPYEQAKRYNDNLPLSEKARWIIISNFSEFWIYDMDTKVPEQSLEKISMIDISQNSSLISFLLLETKIDLDSINLQTTHKIVLSVDFVQALLRSNDFLKLTYLQQKFLFLVLSKIKHDWHKTIFDNIVTLNLSDIIENLNWDLKQQNRRNARIAVKRELEHLKNHSSVNVNNLITNVFYTGNIISAVSFGQELIEVEINMEIIPHLLTDVLIKEGISCLQIYTNEILKFDSRFSIPLYLELLLNKEKYLLGNDNLCTYFIELTFLKKLLGLNDDSYTKYKISDKDRVKIFNSSTFEQRTLYKAINDINDKSVVLKFLSYDDGKFLKRVKSKNTIIGYEFKYIIRN